jgi:hypothetical protein
MPVNATTLSGSVSKAARLPTRLRQLPLRLRQPERHPHLAQHRDRRRQLRAGLVEAADAAAMRMLLALTELPIAF